MNSVHRSVQSQPREADNTSATLILRVSDTVSRSPDWAQSRRAGDPGERAEPISSK